MQLSPGTRVGPYEIIAPLGAGGMGEVYRARDARLSRDVAIKALPPEFAQDPERLARFEREARLLASLNHPNVAAIHGIEEVDGRRHLVLEYVAGQTLADRLAVGPLALDDALDVCRQIATGVEAAHESGVVHRDLKPGNVIVAPDGNVKVLDFGLAVGGGGSTSGSDPNLSHSPTLTHAATRAGVILGTAAYMSPEQARGKTVDRRTDIWSFGCVLYECLTGRQLFQGETVSDLIARILEREPDWNALPARTPPRIRDLLKRCLRKDPKERLRDIGDARLELSEALAHPDAAAVPSAPTPTRSHRLPWGIAAAAVVVAAAAWIVGKPAPAPVDRGTMRVSVPLPAGLTVSLEVPDVVPSPDGGSVLFVAVDTVGTRRLYVRPLHAPTARALPGTEGADIPFWSPDNRHIAFFAGGSLKRMHIDDASAQVLCPAPSTRGAAWSPDDVIVLAPAAAGPLLQIPAGGGRPTPATTLDADRGETAHRFPSFLPDGKHFLYAALPGKNGFPETRVGTLDGALGPIIMESQNVATYVHPGYLVFNQNESIVAQPFDAASLALSGSPRVIQGLFNASYNYSGSPVVMASKDGTIIQREFQTNAMRVTLMDRNGAVLRVLPLPEGRYGSPQFSPDGTRLVVTHAPPGQPFDHVWLVDVARGMSAPFTFAGQWDADPRWTPDGEWIIWGSDRGSGRDIYRRRADGSGEEELLADVPNLFNDPSSVTSDVVIYRSLSGETSEDIWMLPLTGERVATPLIRTPFNELDATVSPDGRWLAYRSDESGRFEAYVVSFPALGAKVRVSSDGTSPTANSTLATFSWRADGRELFYIGGDGRTLMVVPCETGDTFRAGTPAPLFRLPRGAADLDLTGDARTIAVTVQSNAESRSILNLIVNVAAELGGGE